MPLFLVPDSNHEDAAPVLREFNTCHHPGGSRVGGQFCSAPDKGGGGGSVSVSHSIDPDFTERPTPVKVDTVEKAIELILAGKVVELPDIKRVATVLTKLGEMALEAKKLGKDAPNYDLCQVSVPGTNLFCGSKLKTRAFPNGVPRIQMPQLAGEPVAGTEADKLPRAAYSKTEVDASGPFIAHLKRKGIKTTREVVPAAQLKASQAELIGSKVASMMINRDFDPANAPLFISRDNYVIDGHHRWAATVGRDAEDGVLGTSRMRVIRVDALIGEIIFLANGWTRRFGIKSAAGVKRKKAS